MDEQIQAAASHLIEDLSVRLGERFGGAWMPMTRLADEVSFSSGGFTKLADRLEADGLIERRADPADRRVRNAALTPEGERLARLVMALVIRGLRQQLLGPLSEDGVRTLATLLARLDPE